MSTSTVKTDCKVSAIYFNYYMMNVELWGEHPEYGMNVMPEDLSRFPALNYNAVAYAMDGTKGKQLKLHAEFSGPPDGELMIRTVNPAEQENFEWESYLGEAGILLQEEEKSGEVVRLLGDVEPITVKFDSDGNSFVHVEGSIVNPVARDKGVVELTIGDADIWRRGVFASWQLWQWQYSSDKGKTWNTASGLFANGISAHRVFVTKSVATWPWTSYDEDVKHVDTQHFVSRPPYVGALEWACKWAQGETTEHGIATQITKKLNDCGRFKYSVPGGNPNYTSSMNNYFDCSRFIDRLNGKFGRGPNVNCVDCASMVMSLANALGCQLKTGRIENPDKTEFALNPLILIGFDKPSEMTAFYYHQIAFNPNCKEPDKYPVFDACLKYDKRIFEDLFRETPAELNIIPDEERHPTGIPLGQNVYTYGYLAILAKREETPSQKKLKMNDDDTQIFGIGALIFS